MPRPKSPLELLVWLIVFLVLVWAVVEIIKTLAASA
jgi:hypothetical protein